MVLGYEVAIEEGILLVLLVLLDNSQVQFTRQYPQGSTEGPSLCKLYVLRPVDSI